MHGNLSLHANLTEDSCVRTVHYNLLHSIQKHVIGCTGPCTLKEDEDLSLKGDLDIKNSCNLSQMDQVNLEPLRDILKDQGYTGSGWFSGTRSDLGKGSAGGQVLILEVFLADGTAAFTISFSKRTATVSVARLESSPQYLLTRRGERVEMQQQQTNPNQQLRAWHREAWFLEPPCLLHL